MAICDSNSIRKIAFENIFGKDDQQEETDFLTFTMCLVIFLKIMIAFAML
jgi:hypothetical protein